MQRQFQRIGLFHKPHLIQTTVKFPKQLKVRAMRLVVEGHFKNFSDIAITGVREVVEEYTPNSSAFEVRKIRKDWEDELLTKAKGDKKKAMHLFQKELEQEMKMGVYKNITH